MSISNQLLDPFPGSFTLEARFSRIEDIASLIEPAENRRLPYHKQTLKFYSQTQKQQKRMNPFIKNCRTGYHDDILNRTSHYLKLLSTKSSITNKQQHNYLSILKQNNQKEIQQERLNHNQKLMESLVGIERRGSCYGAASERHFRRRRLTLKNEYEQRQKELTLSKDNIRLYKKIVGVQPSISKQKLKKFDQDITRYSKLINHPYREICEMDEQFFETYRNGKGRNKKSPCRVMTEEVKEGGKAKRRHNKRKLKKLFTVASEENESNNPESRNT